MEDLNNVWAGTLNYEANFIPVNAAGTLFIGVYYTDISSNFVLFSHVLYRYMSII